MRFPIALVALGILPLAAASAQTSSQPAAPATPEKPAITRGAPGAVPPRPGFAPVALPDSVPEDLRAAAALRLRVARAYWPEWAEAVPAPVVLRSDPYDFFINHPTPPRTSTAPAPIPGGGGVFETSMSRLEYPSDPLQRVETQAGVTCVSYNTERGRPGSTTQVAAMLAHRDFLAYETAIATPVWTTAEDASRVRRLRSDPDLIAWLDEEGDALKQAVAAADPAQRLEWARRAVRAAAKAHESVEKKPELAEALAWMRNAQRFEGAGHYVRVVLQAEAAAVAAGDTARALPGEDAPYAERHAAWLARAGSGSRRTVTSAHLGAIAETGALYCVLLDEWSPGWRTRVFRPDHRLDRALAEALRDAGNRPLGKG